MLKNFLIILTFSFFVNNCGYTPMYSTNNEINFNFTEIKISGEDELGDLIESNLKRFTNKEIQKEIKLEIDVIYNKLSQTKDTAGETTEYLLVAEVKCNVLSEGKEKKILIKKDFVMKNMDEEFEEKKYETTIKQNFAYSIVNRLIMQLSVQE